MIVGNPEAGLRISQTGTICPIWKRGSEATALSASILN